MTRRHRLLQRVALVAAGILTIPIALFALAALALHEWGKE